MATQQQSGDSVERELAQLMEIEKFPPPADFARHALVNDESIYEEAAKDPPAFWAKQARELLHWETPFQEVLDWSDAPHAKWFADGRLNVSYNCLDRHVEAGNGDRVAFHWRGEEGEERTLTYADMLAETQKFANAMKARGIGKGDVVGIYLPMIPEVAIVMLACTRIGAIHNVVFGGFSAQAVKDRMQFSDAKALVTVNEARRKGKTAPIKQQVDELMGDLDHLETIFVVRNTDADCPMRSGRDVWVHEAMAQAPADCPAEPMGAEDPLYILYSSGSTGTPKGVLHTTGGYLLWVTLTTKYVFDVKPEQDTFWCGADVGWVTGHSYIVYGPMSLGMSSVMFEGAPDYPHKGIMWELIERYGVTQYYTSPTAIRTHIKWGPEYPDTYDLSSLRMLGTVGEPINPKAWLWYHKVIGKERCPIVDTWWQTETGGDMITPLPGVVATKPGSATRPFPGIQPKVVDEQGTEVPRDTQGFLVITQPWPGMLRTLYRDDDRFEETYFSKYGKETYLVGDAARQDSDGYFWIIGRVDDVVNVSGHRMSTAEVESAIVAYPKVAEAAVVGQSDEDSGQAVCAFVTLQGDLEGNEELEAEIREHVAQRIGKFARPKRILWSESMPKTRSGKIMRRLLRDIAEGRELGDVTTLLDPAVTDAIRKKVEERQAAGVED
jgi:acetyl-CoA synthetase